MNYKLKVNAVVVTYNRLSLLKKTIEHLEEQTYELSKIVIVDNASTDGTQNYLKDLSNEKVENVFLEKNIGGAGGFYYGIKRAFELGCDFIWIMDDDTICTPTALNELIQAYFIITDNPKRKVGFLSSDVRWTNNQPCLMNISNPERIYNEFISEGIVQISHSSFVAMLIPSFVVKEVGLPYKDFFIWGDDGEYSTRILQNYRGYLVGKSAVYHYMKENIGVDIFDTPPERIKRFYYFYRNWTFTRLSRSKKDGIHGILANIKLIYRIAKSHTKYKGRKILTILRGTWAGICFKAQIDYID